MKIHSRLEPLLPGSRICYEETIFDGDQEIAFILRVEQGSFCIYSSGELTASSYATCGSTVAEVKEAFFGWYERQQS
jgi:hypothetical protein